MFYFERHPTLTISRYGRRTLPGEADGPVITWTAEHKIVAMLKAVPEHLVGAAREQFEAFLTPENLAIMAATMAVLGGIQAIPGADAVVDTLMVGLAWYQFGWAGVVACKELIEAFIMAIRAKSRTDIKTAAKLAAIAVLALGVTVLLYKIIARTRESRLPKPAPNEEPDAPTSLRKEKTNATNNSGPGAWKTVNESMSDRASAYQEQITGQAVTQSYVVNGVKFDGFKNGVLLDAKGPGYANFVNSDGEFQPWFNGQQSLLNQARSQIEAANGVPITWSVAEPSATSAIQNLLQGSLRAINVVNVMPK